MAIIDFPSSPSVNDTYSFGNKTWVFNGQGWQLVSSSAINDVVIGNITPASGNFTTVGATGNITASGNIAGSYILGNGAFLTGIAAGYSNANVKDYLGNFDGNIIPSANVTYDLGSNTNRWNDLYLNNSTIYIGSQEITANATTTQFSGNVSANYLFGNASFLVGVSDYSNANVANYLPNYQGLISNVDFRSTSPAAVALVVTDRPLTMGGNSLSYVTLPDDGNANSVAAELTNHGTGNVLISAGPADYEWIFDHTGNLTLPGSTFAINYANGQQVSLSGTYSNINVKAYLESGATINANFGGGTLKTTGVANLGPLTVSGNLTVAGNISATGNLTYINVQDLVIDDPLIYLGASNPSDVEDLGIVAAFTDGVYQHTGFARDYTDKTWKVFTGVTSEPNTVIAWNQAVMAPFKAGSILSNASITANANVTAVGNVSGTYILGNGAFLTGLPAGYSNADVANYLASNAAVTILTTGNVTTTANVTANNFIGNSATLTGNLSAGNVSVANGNITVGNLVGAGTNVEIVSGAYTWTFDGAGNLTGNGNISAGNFVGTAGNTSIVTGAYAWVFNDAGNFVLPSNSFSVNYANGTQVSLGGSYSNSEAANYLASNAAVTILTTGNITTQGNITGNYILGNGALLTGLPATYGNANVAAYLASNSNITLALGTGNITTQGNITAGNLSVANGNITLGNLVGSGTNVEIVSGAYTWTFDGAGNLTGNGNISAGNFVGSAGNTSIVTNAYSWTFNDSGNLVLPGNTFAINYANGTQVSLSGTYANSNVSAYLASNAAVTVLTTGNITTSANVSGAYILGNGAFLSGLPVTYSNSNVAAYLAVYNGNALFSNITVSQDAVVLGNLRVEGNTTYINVTDLVIEDKDIIVAANATATLTDLNGAGLQIGNRTAGGNITFFYNSTSNVMSLSHGANIANVLNVTGNITATGNTTSGNVNLTGNIVDTGALTIITGAAGNITLAPNSTSVLIATTTGVNIAGYLNTTGNISAGNVIGSGNNVEVTAGSYNWAFDNTGNFTLSGNTFAVNYANGTQVALGGNYSNTNVAAYLPTYTGNISAGNVTAVGNVSANNISANSISANAVSGSNVNVRLISDSYTWTFNNTGNFVLPGNSFSINYANGTQVALGGNYSNSNVANYLPTYTGNISAGNLNLTGNIVDTGALTIITGSAGNITLAPGNTTILTATTTGINVSGTFNTTGNITGGNLIGSGNNVELSAGAYTWVFDNTGNFTLAGNSFSLNYANGSQVSLSGTYSNTNVAAYLPTYTGAINSLTGNVITTANVSGAYLLGNGYFVSGIQYSNITGAYSNTNVLNYLQSGATINANFGGGNITTTGTANLGITQVNGNLVVTGNISATGNITYINVSDLVVSDPLLFLAANNPGDTEDIGLVANYNSGGGNLHTGFARDYTDSTWKLFQAVTSDPNTVVAWNEAVYAPFKAGSILSNASITANANVVATGNVSGTYLLGNGYFVSGIQYSNITGAYSNATVANYLASNAAVTILTTGNITTAANISAGNIVGAGTNTTITTNGYTWIFDNTGNLTTPGNIEVTANVIADYFIGNGAFLTGLPAGYSNADAANYLASNAAVTILTTGNITTAANIAGNYILGNGSQLTGISTSSIFNGNSNVSIDTAAGNTTVAVNGVNDVVIVSHAANLGALFIDGVYTNGRDLGNANVPDGVNSMLIGPITIGNSSVVGVGNDARLVIL